MTVSRSGATIAATVAALIVAWLQFDGAHAVVRLWAVALVVPLPVLMIVQSRMIAQLETLPRVPAYVSSIISLWTLATATALAGWAGGLTPAELHLAATGAASIVLPTLVVTAAGVTVLFAFRAAGVRETDTLRELLPVTRTERLLFVAVSVTAGVCEEFIFRGFLLTVLTQSTGSAAVAVMVSSGAFGVLHAYQHPAGAMRAALLGALLAVSVIATGSLYPAILAHILIDLLSGLWLARYLLR